MELHEHRSVAKKYLIEAVQALGENLLIQGVGHKTGPIDYIENSVPLVGGDLGVMKLNRDEL